MLWCHSEVRHFCKTCYSYHMNCWVMAKTVCGASGHLCQNSFEVFLRMGCHEVAASLTLDLWPTKTPNQFILGSKWTFASNLNKSLQSDLEISCSQVWMDDWTTCQYNPSGHSSLAQGHEKIHRKSVTSLLAVLRPTFSTLPPLFTSSLHW